MTPQNIVIDRPSIVVVAPRALRENDAAAYLSLSAPFLRNLRTQDARRKERGEPIQGPRWISLDVGRGSGARPAVRYLREDLDRWLDDQGGPRDE